MRKRESSRCSEVPFGGVEAEAEERERDLEESLGAGDRHGDGGGE